MGSLLDGMSLIGSHESVEPDTRGSCRKEHLDLNGLLQSEEYMNHKVILLEVQTSIFGLFNKTYHAPVAIQV